jgi:hypothetical protein
MELKRRSAPPEVQENYERQIQKECLSDINISNTMGSQLSTRRHINCGNRPMDKNVTQYGSDPKMGWWSWVTVKVKGTSQTKFITAYRVCDQTPITQDYVYGTCRATESGTKLRTSHTQQLSLLLEDNAECCDLRKDFITDLEKFITSLTVKKIIMS